jgi:hypothetical protein
MDNNIKSYFKTIGAIGLAALPQNKNSGFQKDGNILSEYILDNLRDGQLLINLYSPLFISSYNIFRVIGPYHSSVAGPASIPGSQGSPHWNW